MADITNLCNQALAAVGTRSTIASINEKSNEAAQCLIHFDSTRRQLLRAAHWGFARSYVQGTVYKVAYGAPERPPGQPPPPASGWDPLWEPPPPWQYAYLYPVDALAIRYIMPDSPSAAPSPPIFGTMGPQYAMRWTGPPVKFIIADMREGSVAKKVILTNQSQAIFVYTRNETDTEMFDISFEQAFVQALAGNMAFTLTGDLKLVDALFKMTNLLILEARVKDANEDLTVIDMLPDWLRVRGAGPSAMMLPTPAEYGPLFGGG